MQQQQYRKYAKVICAEIGSMTCQSTLTLNITEDLWKQAKEVGNEVGLSQVH